MSDTMDPWAVVHHEDAPEEAPPPKATPKPAPEPPAEPAKSESPPMMMPVAMQMGVSIPPDMIEAVKAIAETQQAMARQFAGFAEAVSAWMEQAQSAAMTSARTAVISQDALADEIKAQAMAQADLAGKIDAWTKTIEAAILAPRRVTLERGKDGMATGAVSETTNSNEGT